MEEEHTEVPQEETGPMSAFEGSVSPERAAGAELDIPSYTYELSSEALNNHKLIDLIL